MSRLLANSILLTAGAIWGMGFVAQSTAMDAIGPLLFVALRSAIAMLVTLPFAIAEGRRAADGPVIAFSPGFVLAGLALFGGIVFQQIGLVTTTVTNSGFLTGLYVVFVPILMTVILRRPPHPVVWPGAILAFAGLVLLSDGALTSLRPGDLFTILAAVFWAMQVILVGRQASMTGRPVALAFVQFSVCTLLGLAAALAFEPIEWSAIQAALPEILYAGAIASGLAFTLQAIGQRYAAPATAAILLSTEVLFAALFGAVLLGETIGSLGYLGGLLIFVAILLIEVLPARQARNAAASS
jgi:drug/metabolite transporter (DMT)-like permease